MAIELATQFQAYTDEQFYSESKTSLVTNKDFSFDGAKTIKLYKMQSTEMEDFNRNGPILEGNKCSVWHDQHPAGHHRDIHDHQRPFVHVRGGQDGHGRNQDAGCRRQRSGTPAA